MISETLMGTSDFESPKVVFFVSDPKLYGIPKDAERFLYENETVKIYETWQENTSLRVPPGIGEYRITIEVPVINLDQLREANSDGAELITSFQKLWPYVCGEPLNPVGWRFDFNIVPQGWTSNSKDLEHFYLKNSKRVVIHARVKHQSWVFLPYFPLRYAMIALQNQETLSNVFKSLMDIHFQAVNARFVDGRLFLFAKAVELVSKLIPGRTHRDKHASLPDDLKKTLTRSIDWLFQIANNRFDFRHVVKDPIGPQLHPKATRDEMSDYEKNADFLIRYYVSKQLGIPTPILHDGPPPGTEP
jgi:hypothetical protein